MSLTTRILFAMEFGLCWALVFVPTWPLLAALVALVVLHIVSVWQAMEDVRHARETSAEDGRSARRLASDEARDSRLDFAMREQVKQSAEALADLQKRLKAVEEQLQGARMRQVMSYSNLAGPPG